jgi:hypothetical protein
MEGFSGRGQRRLHRMFAPGDAVRVSSGELRGLTGVVARMTNGTHWLVSIDGLSDGIYAVVDGAVLEPCKPEHSEMS